MNKLTEKMFEMARYGYFSTQDIAALFPGSEDRRYGLVKRAIAGGEILHIRRGLYCLAPKYQKQPISLYGLAQHIYGPSYISLESALSRYGLIPEAVYTVTSVSYGKSKEFRTPLGTFSYDPVRQKIFLAGVKRETEESGQAYLIASAVKALADYMYVRRKSWTGLGPAAAELRMEPAELGDVSSADFEDLLENYASRRVQKFLQGLRKDLKL